MAWYRCGGGGIPSSLKTDMNAVYNKKFGTSTTYDPSVWASTANLMGPLPERTASGSIAAISDGADRVPLKSWEIEIGPDLSGKSSVVCTQTNGANVWDEAWEVGAINIVNGENVANSNFIRSTNYISVKPSTIYYKCAPQNILQLYYGADKSYISYGSWGKNGTFTTPANCYYVRFYVAQEYGTTYNNDIAINYPSTETAYSAHNIIVNTVSLGRTVYGGTADVVKGEGVDENDDPYTFTPISVDTKLGVNNFWADAGDSSITYRADIDLLLGGN